MSQESADLVVHARWMLPAAESAPLLEDHALAIRDGRILAVLPIAEASRQFAGAIALERREHVLIPGLIDSAVGSADWSAAGAPPTVGDSELARRSARRTIAALVRAGIGCFAARGPMPEALAHAAADAGVRAVIGLPVAGIGDDERSGREAVSRALALRDVYQGHPLVGTAFAPRSINGAHDALLERIATLVNELDARIVVDLHASQAEVDASLARHGRRPIERLADLGLLTPSLQAVHMCRVEEQDLELAERSGIGVSLCPFADIDAQNGTPPAPALLRRLRCALGSGGARHLPLELWTDLRLTAALNRTGTPAAAARRALEAATRGGAQVLGLDEVGVLEPGRWADVCCIELPNSAVGDSPRRGAHAGHGVRGEPPAGPELDPLTELAFGGGAGRVSDVWVAGRPLLCNFTLTGLE